jgi:DNA mismatch repair ATPase MutS
MSPSNLAENKSTDIIINLLFSYCLEAVEKPATGNVSNADAEEKWIRYTHRLIPGVMKIERYGLRLAKLSLMPQEVTEAADKILTHLISSRKVK